MSKYREDYVIGFLERKKLPLVVEAAAEGKNVGSILSLIQFGRIMKIVGW